MKPKEALLGSPSHYVVRGKEKARAKGGLVWAVASWVDRA